MEAPGADPGFGKGRVPQKSGDKSLPFASRGKASVGDLGTSPPNVDIL